MQHEKPIFFLDSRDQLDTLRRLKEKPVKLCISDRNYMYRTEKDGKRPLHSYFFQRNENQLCSDKTCEGKIT